MHTFERAPTVPSPLSQSFKQFLHRCETIEHHARLLEAYQEQRQYCMITRRHAVKDKARRAQLVTVVHSLEQLIDDSKHVLALLRRKNMPHRKAYMAYMVAHGERIVFQRCETLAQASHQRMGKRRTVLRQFPTLENDPAMFSMSCRDY